MIFIWNFDEYLLHFGYVLWYVLAQLLAGITGQILDRPSALGSTALD